MSSTLRRRGRLGAVVAVAVGSVLLTLAAGAGAARAGADPTSRTRVPGAERQTSARLDDLTTAGTLVSGHTDPADWVGLSASGTRSPRGVPGVQIDGYFPDSSTFNKTHGWNHDAQFVIRLPDDWNGGLVVAGSPGNREQYANDVTISDWVLARGYAYAVTDKGNVGTSFYEDGRRPGDAIVEWNHRVTELTRAALRTVERHYGRPATKTYAAGISNGGYLVRWQLENHPELYDGGLDWEGTLWRSEEPNLFSYLPTAVREYPRGNEQALLDVGFANGSQFLWEYHYANYWGPTQRIYREELDPSYDGDDADYVYADRPDFVRRAVERISLSGEIGRPLITLHGDLDSLLPMSRNADVYADLVERNGRSAKFRYYRIEDGNHVDGLYDVYPDRLRPILPCFRAAFDALESWPSTPPPDSGTIERPVQGEVVNQCALP